MGRVPILKSKLIVYIAALLLALTGDGVNIPRPGCGHLVATFVSWATQAGALGSVFCSSSLQAALKAGCLELGFCAWVEYLICWGA